MSIAFSGRWNHYSWSSEGHTDQESERQLILEMIRNCDSDLIKSYADSNSGGQVYVRTGIHSSQSESRDHVQVQLGASGGSYQSSEWPGYTGHIIYHRGMSSYEASVVRGLHSGHY